MEKKCPSVFFVAYTCLLYLCCIIANYEWTDEQKNLPVLADQVVHQVFHLVRPAIRHNELLEMLEVFGLQQFLVLAILANKCQHSLPDLRNHGGNIVSLFNIVTQYKKYKYL